MKTKFDIPMQFRRACEMFAVALGIRFIYLILFPAGPLLSDPWKYYRLAEIIARTGMFLELDGSFTAYQPPGTTILLAPFTMISSRWAMDIFFALMTSAIAAMAYLFFAVCGVEDKRALVAGAIFAVFPAGVLYSGFPNSEVPFTLLLFAAFIVIATRGGDFGFFKAGFVIGVATLFRTLGLMVLPIALWFDYRLNGEGFDTRKFLRRGILLLAGFAIIVAPLSIRNAIRMGTPSLSTNTGINLRIGNFDGAHGGYNSDAQTLPDSLPENLRNREYTSMALSWIAENPVAWIKLVPKKILNLWGLQAVGIFLRNSPRFKDGSFWLIAAHVVWFIILILSCIGLVRNWNWRGDPVFALSIVSVVGITLFHVVFFGSGRFRFPVEWALAYWIALDLSKKAKKA
ncbi:MAG: hypothetical protein ACP5G4_09880 [bacterium]